MVNKNTSDFAIGSICQQLFFLQAATCFTCFLLLEIPLFNTVEL